MLGKDLAYTDPTKKIGNNEINKVQEAALEIYDSVDDCQSYVNC